MPTKLSPGSGFALRFFSYLLLCSVAFWAFSLHRHLAPVQRTIASLSAMTARGMGGHIRAHGHDIVVSGLVMNVNHECTGIFVCMLFASFVLAYPASWASRFGALAIGIPLFSFVNVFRLATLARVAEIYPNAFFYLHEYVWQGILMVCVLAGALAWAEKYG
ncbi:MAG: archaeosortase/exosortase family protein [Candidatus Binatia bacterium]